MSEQLYLSNPHHDHRSGIGPSSGGISAATRECARRGENVIVIAVPGSS